MKSCFSSLRVGHERAWNKILKYIADKQQAYFMGKVEAGETTFRSESKGQATGQEDDGSFAGEQMPGIVSAQRGAKADGALHTAGKPEES